MPVSLMYVHSKCWMGKGWHTPCNYKTLLMWNTAGFLKQGQDFGAIIAPAQCSSFLLLTHETQQLQTISTKQEVSWVGEGKKSFKALIAFALTAVPADCHCRLCKRGGLGGHTQPVAAVHIFLGHSSRVRHKSLYSQPCLKWPCATS